MYTSTLLLTLPLLASAHFQLEWPTVRGKYNSDTLDQYPCGGSNTPGERTEFPISGGPIQINNEHTESKIQVLLAIGDNPTGDDFVYVMRETFYEQGPEEFCIGMAVPPAAANVSAGTKGTISVVTSGDASGGLYQCADIVFTSTPLSESDYASHCKNATGVQVSTSSGNANGSSSASSPPASQGSDSPSGSGSGDATAPTNTPGAASVNGLGSAVAVVVAAVGVAALF